MRKVKPVKFHKNDLFKTKIEKLGKTVNQLVAQAEEYKEEIRLIKSKLRVNRSFGKRR